MCECAICQNIDTQARKTAQYISDFLKDPKNSEIEDHERLVDSLKNLWAMDAIDFDPPSEREMLEYDNRVLKAEIERVGDHLNDKLYDLLTSLPPFSSDAWSLQSEGSPLSLFPGQLAIRPWRLVSHRLDKEWGTIYAAIGHPDDQVALKLASELNKDFLAIQQPFPLKLDHPSWVHVRKFISKNRNCIVNFDFLIEVLCAILRRSHQEDAAKALEASEALIR